MDTVTIILAPLAGLPQWVVIQAVAHLYSRLKFILQRRPSLASRDGSTA